MHTRISICAYMFVCVYMPIKFSSYVFKVSNDNWFLGVMSPGSMSWFSVSIDYSQDFSCGLVYLVSTEAKKHGKEIGELQCLGACPELLVIVGTGDNQGGHIT